MVGVIPSDYDIARRKIRVVAAGSLRAVVQVANADASFYTRRAKRVVRHMGCPDFFCEFLKVRGGGKLLVHFRDCANRHLCGLRDQVGAC